MISRNVEDGMDCNVDKLENTTVKFGSLALISLKQNPFCIFTYKLECREFDKIIRGPGEGGGGECSFEGFNLIPERG